MNFKPILVVALATMAMAAGVASAQAGHRTGVGFGFGFGFESEDCAWLGRTYHCFGPHIGNPHYGRHEHFAYTHMACGEARRRVQDRGFRKIKTENCTGKNYTFIATKKGHHYRVKVNAFTGRIKASAL